jgi:hypothetical protein
MTISLAQIDSIYLEFRILKGFADNLKSEEDKKLFLEMLQ